MKKSLIAGLALLGLLGAHQTAVAAPTAADAADALAAIAAERETPAWREWLESLRTKGFRVAQGGVKLFDNAACKELIAVFHSCFANNPAAPYFVPEPPTSGGYVNRDYAARFVRPGLTGAPSNMIFSLGETDAVVTVVRQPGRAAYMGYQSYVFTRDKNDYPAESKIPRTYAPGETRYEIFGSLGNAINDVIVGGRLGSAWDAGDVAYVTTANPALAKALIKAAQSAGFDPQRIFVEKAGDNVKTGSGAGADELIALIRYALPENDKENQVWQGHIKKNVQVFRVTAPVGFPRARFPTPDYTPKAKADETAYDNSLQELSGLLGQWLTTQQAAPSTVEPMTGSMAVAPSGKFRGFVGKQCIKEGHNCLGDAQDTDSYRFGGVGTLADKQYAVLAGINHVLLDNASYISIGVYNGEDQTGVASASQTSVRGTKFESGTLNESAGAVLRRIGYYEKASEQLKKDLPFLYTALISRNCADGDKYCILLPSDDTLPPNAKVSVFQRAYIKPGTTTGAEPNKIPSPNLIFKTAQ
jgi:hypothetical protein